MRNSTTPQPSVNQGCSRSWFSQLSLWWAISDSLHPHFLIILGQCARRISLLQWIWVVSLVIVGRLFTRCWPVPAIDARLCIWNLLSQLWGLQTLLFDQVSSWVQHLLISRRLGRMWFLFTYRAHFLVHFSLAQGTPFFLRVRRHQQQSIIARLIHKSTSILFARVASISALGCCGAAFFQRLDVDRRLLLLFGVASGQMVLDQEWGVLAGRIPIAPSIRSFWARFQLDTANALISLLSAILNELLNFVHSFNFKRILTHMGLKGLICSQIIRVASWSSRPVHLKWGLIWNCFSDAWLACLTHLFGGTVASDAFLGRLILARLSLQIIWICLLI